MKDLIPIAILAGVAYLIYNQNKGGKVGGYLCWPEKGMIAGPRDFTRGTRVTEYAYPKGKGYGCEQSYIVAEWKA